MCCKSRLDWNLNKKRGFFFINSVNIGLYFMTFIEFYSIFYRFFIRSNWFNAEKESWSFKEMSAFNIILDFLLMISDIFELPSPPCFGNFNFEFYKKVGVSFYKFYNFYKNKLLLLVFYGSRIIRPWFIMIFAAFEYKLLKSYQDTLAGHILNFRYNLSNFIWYICQIFIRF